VIGKDKATLVDSGCLVIGLCAAAMYVFVPQGRIQGVRSMTMAMASSLFGDGRSYTSDFKTEAIYLFQPVLGTPEVKVH